MLYGRPLSATLYICRLGGGGPLPGLCVDWIVLGTTLRVRIIIAAIAVGTLQIEGVQKSTQALRRVRPAKLFVGSLGQL